MSAAAATIDAPYYSADGVTVYRARWEDVVGAGLVPADVALIHADPPYGIGHDVYRPGKAEGRVHKNTKGTARNGAEAGKARNWRAFAGNDQPFDPAPLLAMGRPIVLWGADHYASRLPDLSTRNDVSWVVWDKRDGTVPDDGSDTELAWTSLGGARRTFRHCWRGLVRASETGTAHLYPSQKPIALSMWIFERARLRPGDLVFVPFMGSGPDLAACRAAGLRCIACDVSEEACRVAVGARLRAAPRPDVAGPLFGGAT